MIVRQNSNELSLLRPIYHSYMLGMGRLRIRLGEIERVWARLTAKDILRLWIQRARTDSAGRIQE